MTHKTKRHLCLMLLVAISATGCTSSEPLQSRLDESTGLTIVTIDTPVVLARPTRLAVAARDYAYLGPVEINRMGDRTHYLWIGLASTLDRARVSAQPPQVTTLVLIVDGSPMTLPLANWDIDLEVPPYTGNTPINDSLAARATVDQIERIARADTVVVYLITKSGTSLAYRVWDGDWLRWSAFATDAAGNL